MSLPTISDSTRVLTEKGLVTKQPDPRHARASLVSLTAKGARTAATVREWPDFMMSALGDLGPEEQSALLRTVIKMIRRLQRDGFIPVERMCVSCRHFQPRVFAGPKPHHCAFVDAPLADHQVRIDCEDHEPALEEQRVATWEAFTQS